MVLIFVDDTPVSAPFSSDVIVLHRVSLHQYLRRATCPSSQTLMSFGSRLALQPEPAAEPPSALVPFLQKYADVSNKKASVSSVFGASETFPGRTGANRLPRVVQVLKLELKEIREQQDLLFRFMNFLKQEGAVHVLQFCLTVGKNPRRPSAASSSAAAPL